MSDPLGYSEGEQELLSSLKVSSFSDLLQELPQNFLVADINIPQGISELDVLKNIESTAGKNVVFKPQRNFLGAGIYYRFIPSAVDYISARSEFYTAYTPYQPEISQGTLISIFEFQTYMAALTGMEISNASLYDGATALAESVKMASRLTSKSAKKYYIVGALSPNYQAVLDTYNAGYGYEVEYFESAANISLPEDLAAIVFMYPDFFGQVVDYEYLIKEARRVGAGVIFGVTNPLALSLYKTPGEWGADIVFGEAVSLGNYPSFGGPALGFIATKKDFVRHLPGRIVGETVDALGRVGYVLTFQTREQHIRREMATSNICSNQALIALRTTIYLTLLGQKGIVKLASQLVEKTNYLRKSLMSIEELTVNATESFQDLLIISDKIDFTQINIALKSVGVQGGLVLSKLDSKWKGYYLVTVNEFMQNEDIDSFVQVIKDYVYEH